MLDTVFATVCGQELQHTHFVTVESGQCFIWLYLAVDENFSDFSADGGREAIVILRGRGCTFKLLPIWRGGAN